MPCHLYHKIPVLARYLYYNSAVVAGEHILLLLQAYFVNGGFRFGSAMLVALPKSADLIVFFM